MPYLNKRNRFVQAAKQFADTAQTASGGGQADYSQFTKTLPEILSKAGYATCAVTENGFLVREMGFDGIVPSTGNLIPKKFSDLYEAVVRGDQATANKLQAEIDPIADLHQKDMLGSEMITGLKVMMNEMGLCEPWVLPPLSRLNPEKEHQLPLPPEDRPPTC